MDLCWSRKGGRIQSAWLVMILPPSRPDSSTPTLFGTLMALSSFFREGTCYSSTSKVVLLSGPNVNLFHFQGTPLSQQPNSAVSIHQMLSHIREPPRGFHLADPSPSPGRSAFPSCRKPNLHPHPCWQSPAPQTCLQPAVTLAVCATRITNDGRHSRKD